MSMESDPHYVTEDSGVWMYIADIPHDRRVEISRALEARHIEYRFGAPPITAVGRMASGTLRLYVTRPAASAARVILQRRSDAAPAAAAVDRDAEVTRMLCATAVRSASFAESVLKYLKSRSIAVAPEIGIDVPLLAQVCASTKERSARWAGYFFAMAAVSVIVSLLLPVVGPPLFVIGTMVLGIAKTFSEAALLRHFRKGQFSRAAAMTAFAAATPIDVATGFPEPEQNLVVYRWFTPFVGVGNELDGWNFTIDVTKGARDVTGETRTPKPFAETELYEGLIQAVRALDLPNTTVRELAFVFGEDIRDDRRLLPDIYGRPVQTLTEEEIRGYRDANDHRVRCYPCIRIHDWETQIVLSQFIRLRRHGKHLFVELNRYLLTAPRDEYRRADVEPRMTFRRELMMTVIGALSGPFLGLAAPFQVLSIIGEAVKEVFFTGDRLHRRTVDENPRFNYGTARSLRDSVNANEYTRYFQKQDTLMYSKILQTEILETVIDFLEAHDIDTSEMREQRLTLLNSGIIVAGGNVNAGALSVGAHSTAQSNRSNPLQQLRPTVAQPTQKPSGAGR